MTAVKKSVLLAMALLIGVFAAHAGEPERKITATQRERAQESEEVERKEHFTRDPQGNIMPFAQSGEVERKQIAGLPPEQSMTYEQAINRIKVSARVTSLPSDALANIGSYLESDKFDLWKTLNTRADTLAFRDNGQNLVSLFDFYSSSEDRFEAIVTVTNVKTETAIKEFTTGLHDFASLSANGEKIAILPPALDRVEVWNTKTGTKTKSIDLDRALGVGVLFASNSDGSVVALRNNNNSIILLNTQTETYTLLEESDYAMDSVFSPNNKTFVASLGQSIRFWDVETGKIVQRIDLNSTFFFWTIAFNHNATAFATSYGRGPFMPAEIIVWDCLVDKNGNLNIVRRGESIKTEKIVRPMLFSHDNTRLIGVQTLSRNEENWRHVFCWNLETGQPIQRIIAGRGSCTIALSPDDIILAVGTKKNIQLWKKSTALEDALVKQQKTEELGSQKASYGVPAIARYGLTNKGTVPSGTQLPIIAPKPNVQPLVEPIDDEVLSFMDQPD